MDPADVTIPADYTQKTLLQCQNLPAFQKVSVEKRSYVESKLSLLR